MKELNEIKNLLIQLATELDLNTEQGNKTWEDLSKLNEVINKQLKKYEKAI